LRAGKFAVTTELDPPDSADPEEVYKRAHPIITTLKDFIFDIKMLKPPHHAMTNT
jgi:hypothetical protein